MYFSYQLVKLINSAPITRFIVLTESSTFSHFGHHNQLPFTCWTSYIFFSFFHQESYLYMVPNPVLEAEPAFWGHWGQ